MSSRNPRATFIIGSFCGPLHYGVVETASWLPLQESFMKLSKSGPKHYFLVNRFQP